MQATIAMNLSYGSGKTRLPRCWRCCIGSWQRPFRPGTQVKTGEVAWTGGFHFLGGPLLLDVRLSRMFQPSWLWAHVPAPALSELNGAPGPGQNKQKYPFKSESGMQGNSTSVISFCALGDCNQSRTRHPIKHTGYAAPQQAWPSGPNPANCLDPPSAKTCTSNLWSLTQ